MSQVLLAISGSALAGGAAALLVPARARPAAVPPDPEPAEKPSWTPSPRLAAAVAGLGCWALTGGIAGLVLGVLVAVVAPTAFALLEPREQRRRRAELVRAAPVVADLIGSALAAGVPLERVVPVVAKAMGGAVEEVLTRLARRVEMGAEQSEAWLALANEPGFDALGRAAARSARTGAPLADILITEGTQLRAAATAQGLADVHAAGVSAVMPLGLCLLPAFVLLGIVPVVAGMLVNI